MLSKSGWDFFKLLCNKHFTGSKEALRSLVGEESFEILSNIDYSSDNPNILLFQPEALISATHYSWFKPMLQDIPESIRPLVIRALPAEVAKKLINNDSPEGDFSFEYPPQVRNFLFKEFFRYWKEKDILPKEFIPETKLTVLLNCTKSQLLDIVDLLAINDLVSEVRHVVEQKLLKKIIEPLSKKQQNYLKVCLHKKQQITVEPLKLQQLCEDTKIYRNELHRRGLKRFANGLSGQSADFIWYITHIFDIGRGSMIQKLITKEGNEVVLKIMEMNILNALQFLKT